MTTIRCTRKELAQGLEVALDERTTIVVSPDAALATLAGRAFESQKSFPMPRAIDALAGVFSFAIAAKAKSCVVVGHTDELPSAEDSEALSLERATIAAAWLENDPAPWLASYDEGEPEQKRWGVREDMLMLRAMKDVPRVEAGTRVASPNDSGPPKDPFVEGFQKLHGLETDGIVGPITRTKLIEEYFKLSRRAPPSGNGSSEAPADLTLNSTTPHGAGSNFSPEDVEVTRNGDTEPATSSAPKAETTSEDNDADAEDDAREAGKHARIDFFFALGEQPLDPAPGAADGPEYLDWIELATLHKRFVAGQGTQSGLGKISMVLMDKFAQVLHKQRQYIIDGPESFSGVTDSSGMIEHDDVPAGEYQLELTLRFFEEHEEIVDKYVVPALVLNADQKRPQRRLVGVVPRCVMANLKGMLFDTNKCFILNTAIDSLERMRSIYEQNNPGKLLVVGHTDTTADPSYNDPLSLERAEAVKQYLEDDVDGWLKNYDQSAPEKRWGEFEDQQMVSAVMGLSALPSDPVTAYQQFHNTRVAGGSIGPERAALEVDGEMGLNTRRELITDYMLLDGTSLRDNPDFNIEAEAHGCGENFPLDDTGKELDLDPSDDKEDQLDRRVELFFFDAEFGVQPTPHGQNSPKGSTQYPTWRKLAKQAEEEQLDGAIHELLLLGFDLQPVPEGTQCRIQLSDRTFSAKTNAQGVVRLVTAVGVTSCDLAWELAGPAEDETILIEREGVLLTTDQEPAVADHLLNLGFDDPNPEERVRHYQVEFGRQVTGAGDDVAVEVQLWHDGGPKPPAAGEVAPSADASSSLVGARAATPTRSAASRLKTAGVPILATKFVAPGKRRHDAQLTPAVRYLTNQRGHISGMEVPEGSHTAITFLGRPGLALSSLNKTAVSHRDATWVDKVVGDGVRNILYYARMNLPDNRRAAIFVDKSPNGGGEVVPVFQVNVVPHFRNRPMLIRLFGGSVALNGLAVSRWQGSETVDDKRDNTWGQIVDRINALSGSFKHLVINAHGVDISPEGQTPPKFEAMIVCGRGIRRTNLDDWDRLRKFEYIWLSSCNIGLDVEFVKEITRRTGAKVITVDFATVDASIPKEHTTFSLRSLPKIYLPDSTDPLGASTMDRNAFFGGARHSSSGNLEQDLDFNIVAEPKGPTEHTPRPPGRGVP